MKKYYDVTLSADSYAKVKVELTDDEYELIKSLSKKLEEAGDGYQGSIDIRLSKTSNSKNKLKRGMIVHCSTRDEFHRIGKMINELYPEDSSYKECVFGYNKYTTDFCFSTLNESQWEYSPLYYYKKKGYEIIESTEI